MAGFEKDGICVDHVLRDKASPSGVALIFVASDGENSIAVASGANGNLSPADVRKARQAIAAASVLVMQLETPLAHGPGRRRNCRQGGRAGDPQPGPRLPVAR